MGQDSSRARGCGFVAAIVGVVFLAALIAVIVFAVLLMQSADRVKGYMQDANSSYESAKASATQGDFTGALNSARAALNDVNALNAELSGPLWDIAARVPYIGEDVVIGREMASIAGDLSNKAVLPIVNEITPLVDGSTSLLENPLETADHIQALVVDFNQATEVIYDCEKRANALPESHFKQLNDGAGELRHTVTAAADLLRAFEAAVEAVKSEVSNFVSSHLSI